MKKNPLRIAALLVGLTASAAALAIPTLTFVGSWNVAAGPFFLPAPTIYTGQQAAALQFGGSASDYSISTVDNTVANIDYMAWVDTWGTAGGTMVAQDFAADIGSDGLYSQAGDQSAYVNDNLTNARRFNYAFALRDNDNQVSEPLSLALVGLGLFGIGAARRRRAV